MEGSNGYTQEDCSTACSNGFLCRICGTFHSCDGREPGGSGVDLRVLLYSCSGFLSLLCTGCTFFVHGALWRLRELECLEEYLLREHWRGLFHPGNLSLLPGNPVLQLWG